MAISNGAASAIRVAVAGAGPAGFYAAARLLDDGIEVDVIDRLPTPWGLVRLGVAPDHPNIKSVSRVFEAIAARPGFRFLGNVEIGRDLSHRDLMRHYDAVVYALGAQADRRLGIPGEDLRGSLAARAFVAWYNGHPDYADLDVELACERAVVVGNGNVALDVARMLALTPAELAPTDVAEDALRALASSSIREIVILGRRGPAQASFTNPELRELRELGDAEAVVDPADLVLDESSLRALADDTNARRNIESLQRWPERAAAGARTIRLRFLVSPVALVGNGHVGGIEVVRNRLEARSDGAVVAVPTGAHETIPCGLVLRSVGYRGVQLAGVPFDERPGTIPNALGRVLGPDGAAVPGVYCTGWIKRGPTGVIGTNKKDATETIESLLADAGAGRLPRVAGTSAAVDALLDARGVEVVGYDGWRRIDDAERRRGEAEGRPRAKLCRWDELLAAASAEERVTSARARAAGPSVRAA